MKKPIKKNPLFDWLDKVEGKPIGSSTKAINKEIKLRNKIDYGRATVNALKRLK